MKWRTKEIQPFEAIQYDGDKASIIAWAGQNVFEADGRLWARTPTSVIEVLPGEWIGQHGAHVHVFPPKYFAEFFEAAEDDLIETQA